MKKEVKIAHAAYKQSMKNPILHKEERDRLLMQIINSELPNWGGINIKVSKL